MIQTIIPFGITNDDGTIEPNFAFPAFELVWKKIFPAEIEQRYKDNNDSKNVKYIKQYMAYQTKLENKNIFETFTAAYEDIINELRHSWSANQVRHYKQSPQDYCEIELQAI